LAINHDEEGVTYHTSVNGQLINCEYYIEARFVPDVCCNCGGEPSLSFPVFMTIPHIVDNGEQLAGWGEGVQQLEPNDNQINMENQY